MKADIVDVPEYLIVGQQVQVTLDFDPEGDDASDEGDKLASVKYFAQLDSVTFVDRVPRTATVAGLPQTLRRMRSTESLPSSTSNLSLASPTLPASDVDKQENFAFGLRDDQSRHWTLPLRFFLQGGSGYEENARVLLKISIHRRSVQEPSVEDDGDVPPDTFAHEYLSKLIARHVSSIVTYRQVMTVEESIALRHLGTVELLSEDASSGRPDQARVVIGFTPAVPFEVLQHSVSLCEGLSTRRSATKLQILSHELFRVESQSVQQSETLIEFPYDIRLTKDYIPRDLREASFRLMFELQCRLTDRMETEPEVGIEMGSEDRQVIRLSFQCPVDLNELFKNSQQTLEDDLSVAFDLLEKDGQFRVGQSFHASMQIINRTCKDFCFAVTIATSDGREAVDPRMREEDVRALLSGDYVYQHYFLKRHVNWKAFVLPLRDGFEQVLVGAGCIRTLHLPMLAYCPTPPLDGVAVYLPPIRLQDVHSQRTLEFRDYLPVKII